MTKGYSQAPRDDMEEFMNAAAAEIPMRGGHGNPSEGVDFMSLLDQRHQAYSDEVQKIKRTFGFNL